MYHSYKLFYSICLKEREFQHEQSGAVFKETYPYFFQENNVVFFFFFQFARSGDKEHLDNTAYILINLSKLVSCKI